MNALSGRHCARGFPAAGRAFALSLPVALSLCPTSANAAPGQVVAPVALVDFAQPGPRLPQAVDVLQEGRFVVEGSRVAVARVRPGDVMTVSGHPSLELGLGYGAGPLPDGVVFHPGARSVRVPTWSDARFVVVRASGEVGLDAPARPQVARGTLLRTPSVWDALAWQRVEAEVVAWLRARSRSAPSAPSDPDLRALVAELAGLRALAERAGVSAADIAPYLVLHFQREAARLRPLRGPFHVAAPFTIKGGHPVEQDGEPWRRVDAGQTLTVDSEARVLRVAVRTLRPGRARVELSEGDRLAHVVSRDTRGDPATEWSKPSHVRLVLPPGSQAASVRVLSGSALVAVRAYRARPALLDALLGERGARSPAGSSTGEPPTAVGALRRAARYDNDRAHGHLRQLFLDERTPPAMRLALGLELSRGLDPGDPGDVILAQTSVRLLDLVELPEVHGAALRRALLVRLWDLGFQAPVVRYGFARVPLPELPRKLTRVLAGLGPGGAGTLRTEAALLQELEQRLAGSAGASERPLGPYARATRLARQLWRALAPYRLLSTTDGTAPEYEFVPALDDRHRPDACDAWSGRMPRWTWLDRPTDIDVVAERGTHALVSIRTVPGTTPRDAAIVVNETTAVVHARVGLGARLAVRPGRHRFTPKDGPLLVRVPRAGPVACRNLRQLRRWYRPGGKGHVEFGLAPGTEPTPIRVDIRAPSGRMSTLTLAVKDQRFETWARGQVRLDVALSERQPSRPAAGNSPPGSSAEVADTFTVMAPRTVAVRVAARHNRASLRSVPQLRFAPSDPAQPAVLAQLSALRALTTAIRSTDDRERIAVLRRRRADVLRALGQATAADADLQRVGPLQATVPAGPQSGDLPAIAVALPDHVEDVVVLGLAGRLPRLASGPGQAVGPASAPDSGSGALPGLVVRGDPRAALVAANAPVADILPVLAELPPPEQVGPELLADAILALRAGMRMRAAEDYARLGRAMGAGPALARSAALMAEVAAERDDLGLSMRALHLAVMAEDAGVSAAGARARLAEGLRFVEPIAFESSAGTRMLERDLRMNVVSVSLGAQVRRALLDAPPTASILRHGRALSVLVPENTPVRLRALCHALVGPIEGCQPTVVVAGSEQPCEPAVRAAAAPVARPFSCDVAAADEPRRVELRMPRDVPSFGWAAAETASGQPFVHSAHATWNEITREQPLALTVLGPTVVRLRARALARPDAFVHDVQSDAGARVGPDGGAHEGPATGPAFRLVQQPVEGAPVTTALRLPGQVDPAISLPGTGDSLAVGRMLERDLVVETDGAVRLTFASDAPRALVRVEVAQFVAVPEPVQPPVPVVEATVVGGQRDKAGPTVARGFFGVDDPPGAGPLRTPAGALPVSVGARAAFVARQLVEDEEGRDSAYGQINVFAVGPLLPHRLWVGGGFFGRVRPDYDSGGVDGQVTWAPTGVLGLRVSASGRITTQGIAAGRATGMRGRIEALTTLPITADLRLRPFWRATLREVDEDARGSPNVDSEVYSAWADDHRRTSTAGLIAMHQPFFDTFQRYQVSARIDDSLRVDRVDARLALDALPGPRPWPWLGLSVGTSYRPESNLRAKGYARTTMTLQAQLFRWLWPMRLVSLSVALSQWVDTPAVTGSTYSISGVVQLTVQRFGPDGLATLPPQSRILRTLREEASGLFDTRAGGRIALPEGDR